MKTVWLRVHTSRIFISGWVLGGYSGLASALYFCLVNTISDVLSSLYDPLCAIVLWCRPWLVPFSETSSHYRCCYLILGLFRLVDITKHTYWNQTKGLYILRKLSRYSVYTSTSFNGVYTQQGKVYKRAQQSQVKTLTRKNTKSTTQR